MNHLNNLLNNLNNSENFTEFFQFYQNVAVFLRNLANFHSLGHFLEIPKKFHQNFDENERFQSKFHEILNEKLFNIIQNQQTCDAILLNFRNRSGAKECIFCRSRKMLQNEPTLAIAAVDTEENERLRFGVNYSVYSFTSLLSSTGASTISDRAEN